MVFDWCDDSKLVFMYPLVELFVCSKQVGIIGTKSMGDRCINMQHKVFELRDGVTDVMEFVTKELCLVQSERFALGVSVMAQKIDPVRDEFLRCFDIHTTCVDALT